MLSWHGSSGILEARRAVAAMNNWGQEDLSSPTPSTYNNMAASPLGGMGGIAPAANAGAPQQAPYAGANQNLLAEQSFEAPPAVDPSMQPSPMAAQAADAFMNPPHASYVCRCKYWVGLS